MIARPYQEEAIGNIFKYFTIRTGNPVVALPTGTGKAFVQAEFVRRALHWWSQTRVLCITHVKELVEQNHKELLSIWPQAPAGIYSAGLNRKDTHYPITFAGVQSIANRIEWFGHIDLVLIDEAHTVSEKGSAQYSKVIAKLKERNPLLKVIGLTATPYRLGTGHLTSGGLFDDICCDYTSLEAFNYLVDNGYLCPLVPKRTKTELDTGDVAIHGGEFVATQLQAAVDKQTITRAALEEARNLAWDRKHWLVFGAGVTHCNHIAALLNEMGISARAVHTDLPGGDDERDKNIADFKNGQFQALVNMGILTTGFNFPALDCIVMLRPTMSPGLWVQMLGRGTRMYPGKLNCLVLDFAANTRRLGPINDPIIPQRGQKKKTGIVPYKLCPQCDAYNHTRARFCVGCGFLFPEVFKVQMAAATDELIKKTPEKKEKPKKEDVPVVIEEHIVSRVEYAKNLSKDRTKPPTLRATYYCGSRTFNEWLCVEHFDVSKFAWRKARDAWRLMGGGDHPPATVDAALALVGQLQPPNKLRIMHDGSKWPSVVGYEFGAPGIALPSAIPIDDAGDAIPIADDPGLPYGCPPLPAFAPGNLMYDQAVADDEIPF